MLDVSVAGNKLTGGPLVAKVYNSARINVTDIKNGIIGQPCQFKGMYGTSAYTSMYEVYRVYSYIRVGILTIFPPAVHILVLYVPTPYTYYVRIHT